MANLPTAVPLPAFRYRVALMQSMSLSAGSLVGAAASLAGGFTDCSGLEVSTEIFEYAEGGVNGFVHKLPTRTKPSDIVLKRGLLLHSDLWSWIQEVSAGQYRRRDGVIVLCTPNGLPAQAWRFQRGLPIKWTGPTLSASQSAVATESMTIAHEGLENLAASALPALGGILG